MATRYYYGDAVAIKDVWTLTPANVAIGNTFTARINGKDITVTATAGTVANVTALLADAINDNDNEILEFNEVVAVDNTTLVTVTARDAGVPIGLSSTAAGGTATLTAANSTVATGPAFFDNADNYSGDVAPGAADDVVHVKGDILYGLSQGSLALTSFTKKKGSGKIGLPEFHESGGSGYDEYRTTYLTLSSCTTLTIEDDAALVKINTGSGGACTAIIRSEGISEDPDVPAVLIQGSHASNALHMLKGQIGVAFYEGESANWPTMTVGYIADPQGDVRAFIGNDTSTVTSYKQQGGVVESEAAMTTCEMFDGEFTRIAGAHATVNVNGGKFRDRSAANISSMLRVAAGGTADFGPDLRSITVADCQLFAGGTILDPNARVTWTAGIDMQRCKLADVVLDVGEARNLAISAA